MRALPRLLFCAMSALGTTLVARVPDAQAPPGLYMVSADTALDTQTGLVWQRAQVEQYPLTFTDALLRCQNLNLGGFSTGWRLPNIRELLSTVDEREALGPMWDQTVFISTSLRSYWSSTAQASTPGKVWVFTFVPGIFMEAIDRSTSSALVRCVH